MWWDCSCWRRCSWGGLGQALEARAVLRPSCGLGSLRTALITGASCVEGTGCSWGHKARLHLGTEMGMGADPGSEPHKGPGWGLLPSVSLFGQRLDANRRGREGLSPTLFQRGGT